MLVQTRIPCRMLMVVSLLMVSKVAFFHHMKALSHTVVVRGICQLGSLDLEDVWYLGIVKVYRNILFPLEIFLYLDIFLHSGICYHKLVDIFHRPALDWDIAQAIHLDIGRLLARWGIYQALDIGLLGICHCHLMGTVRAYPLGNDQGLH